MKLCGFDVGLDQPFFLIAGPCVIESREMAFETAGQLKEICAELNIPFIYKSSYDKANRSSGKSYRGPGMENGLAILAEVREKLNVPVLTDVHTEAEVPSWPRWWMCSRPRPSCAARPTSFTRWPLPASP